MDISRITKDILKNCQKITPLTVKKIKKIKSLQFLMVHGSLNPNITYLGEKVSIKSVKMKISKNKKMIFFLMSQGSFNPKIRFLGQKVCPVARRQTHTHESDYCGHPFRVSGVFPSTNHQGSAQLPPLDHGGPEMKCTCFHFVSILGRSLMIG